MCERRSALLVLERGERDSAAGCWRGPSAICGSLQGSRHVSPLLAERFASLAEGFRKLGDIERAETVAGWARPAGGQARGTQLETVTSGKTGRPGSDSP